MAYVLFPYLNVFSKHHPLFKWPLSLLSFMVSERRLWPLHVLPYITGVGGPILSLANSELASIPNFIFWFLPLPKVSPTFWRAIYLQTYIIWVTLILFSARSDPTLTPTSRFPKPKIVVYLVHCTIHISRSHCLPKSFMHNALSCLPLYMTRILQYGHF